MSVEVELEVVHYLASLLWQSVFLYEWEHSQLRRSECRRQKQNDAGLSVVELFLTIRVAHDAEEHAVNAY